MTPDEYRVYRQSPRWQRRRKMFLEHVHHRCQVCGDGDENAQLEVYHSSQDTLWNELNEHLVCLCQKCHDKLRGPELQRVAQEFTRTHCPNCGAEMAVEVRVHQAVR